MTNSDLTIFLGFIFFESISNFRPPRFGQTECVRGRSGTRCIYYQRSVQRVPNIIRWWRYCGGSPEKKKRDQIHQTGYYKWQVHHKSDKTRKGGGPILIISSVFLPQLKYNITTKMFCEDADCRFRARSSGNLNGAISTTLFPPAIYLCLPLFNTCVTSLSCLIFLFFLPFDVLFLRPRMASAFHAFYVTWR